MRTCRATLLLGVFAAGVTSCARPGSAAEAAPGAPARHVVIVSIDGLRPDAIAKANAPALQGLIRKGASCPKAETIRPSTTLPSHTSMLTGLDYGRHGVTWNDYRPGHIEHPTVFSTAKKAGRSTAMFFAKDKFHYLADPDALDFTFGSAPGSVKYAETSADALAKVFAREWPAKDYALTFVHIREPDEAGHATGWMGPKYLAAAERADRAVGAMLEAVQKAGRLDRTAVIVTADHGGSGLNHSADKPENTTIPWICVGPGVKPGLTIDRIVRTYDTAPTALAFIGVSPPAGIDGKIVEEVVAAPARGESR